MPLIAIVFGLALIALGLEGYTNQFDLFKVENPYAITSLIPALFGVLLTQCGLAGLRPAWRKHAMHFAAMLGLIGAAAGLGMAGPKAMTLFKSQDQWPENFRPSAVKMQLTMGIISLVFLILCIRSFINARRARKAQQMQ